MKFNKLSLAIVVGLSFGMVACGGNSSSKSSNTKDSSVDMDGATTDTSTSDSTTTDTTTTKPTSGSKSKVLKYSSIIRNSNTDGKPIAERNDTVIKDGHLSSKEYIIKGDGKNDYDYDYSQISLAPEFHSIIPSFQKNWQKTMSASIMIDSVADRKFHFFEESKTNGKKLNTSLQQTTLDISGVTTDDVDKYETALSGFKLINARFPEGSLCYVWSTVNSSFPHFNFDTEDVTDKKNLAEWVTNTKSKHKGALTEYYVNVGENNEYKAVYLEMIDGKEKSGSYPAAVSYKGAIYNGHYQLEVGSFQNTDPTKGIVECYELNDVAADYLEDEIKAYGKL